MTVRTITRTIREVLFLQLEAAARSSAVHSTAGRHLGCPTRQLHPSTYGFNRFRAIDRRSAPGSRRHWADDPAGSI